MKEHPTHKGYFVTEDGKIFSAWQRKANPGFGNSFSYVIDTNKMKELKSWDNKKGYLILNLKGSKKNWKVHRLVAETYLPNPHNLPQINHKNKNTKDNSVSNLEWCTASYNAIHRDYFSILFESVQS
jgi:HNH endonuclease